MTESKFNECVRTQSQRLYLIALSFTKNQADAEDILQNVYLKLWTAKKNLTPTSIWQNGLRKSA